VTDRYLLVDIYMNREELLEQVKQAIREIELKAEIILYGSRARQDSQAQSDWDFLVLLDGPVNDERIDKIRHRLYEIEWQSDEVLCSIIRNREEWNSPLCKSMPFYQNVELDGIVL
jgi:predicted nucleotidyltransferase